MKKTECDKCLGKPVAAFVSSRYLRRGGALMQYFCYVHLHENVLEAGKLADDYRVYKLSDMEKIEIKPGDVQSSFVSN